jgi:hypothetical protein
MYWEITPFGSPDADSCIMPAGTDRQAHAALEYAQDRLEEGWDILETGETATVTIKLCAGCLPEADYDPEY